MTILEAINAIIAEQKKKHEEASQKIEHTKERLGELGSEGIRGSRVAD